MALQITLTFPDDLATLIEERAGQDGTTIEGFASNVLRRAIRREAQSREPNRPTNRSVEARTFLERMATERDVWASVALRQRAKEEGISKNAIYEARDGMEVRTFRQVNGGRAEWFWDLSSLLPAANVR